ncbi:ABC transporter permease [Agromyces italicus]|uniref:ABC transporter permease n=1 Tax=Agromyces italicus TaxID=279572 RepID=UPI001B7FAF73|nr:ABC transporter permease [Agromyces italicus]
MAQNELLPRGATADQSDAFTGSVAAAGRKRTPRARRPALTIAAMIVLGIMLIAAAVGHWIAPYDPALQNVGLGPTGPSAAHWLGTDDLGRDVLSRLLEGAHTALIAPVLIAVGTTVLGTTLGLLAGYRQGWLDTMLMRLTDLMFALPGLLVLIVVVGVAGGGYAISVITLIILGAPSDIRMVRSVTMSQRELAYVDAARTLGIPARRIMFRHVLPNLAPTVVANLLLSFVFALVALAGLSFLGIGLPAGTPDWGLMIQENRGILDINPWAAIAPALLITITACAATLLGDSIYERLDAGKGFSE